MVTTAPHDGSGPLGNDAVARTVRTVAVLAHTGKSLGGGLDALRSAIARHEVDEVSWYEVPKSKKAPKQARKALDEAVRIGFHGARRVLDLGRVNGEHFAVMAGVGFDAEMIRAADSGMKDRLGRVAYLRTGLRQVDRSRTATTIDVDGTRWFDGAVSCVLLGNVGRITGGVPAFGDGEPDDGWLEVGVMTAEGPVQWARAFGRLAFGRSDRSPFIRITRARKVVVRLGTPRAFELDGGARGATERLKARVVPGGLTVCVPADADAR